MARNSNKSKPAVKPVPVPEAISVETDDLSKRIDESKAKIQAESKKPLNRGRGRPPKESSVSDPISSAATSGPATSAPLMAPPKLASTIVLPLKALSMVPANKHKIPELALSDDEALAIGESLDMVIAAFVPDLNAMSPKTAAIVSAMVTIGTVGTSKYLIYAHAMKDKNSKIEKQEAELNKQPDFPPGERIDASTAFRRSNATI